MVPAPVVNSPARFVAAETVVINIPNVNGSYTPVRLVKTDSGYIGPQGELYLNRPTVDQLRVLYGT